MTLSRVANLGSVAAFILLVVTFVFLGHQPLAQAQSLGEQINCEIYAELVAAGSPIPPGFDASACETGGGGGGQTDVCPNLDGIQNTIPEGFDVVDGLCQPHVTDVCPNLDGAQESVPEGYEKNTDGQCVPITPTDVCPNIEGNQETVPTGYHLADGQCVQDAPAPTDVCSNIDGVQTEVPSGMELHDGQCTTPSAGGGGSGGSDTSGGSGGSSGGGGGGGGGSNGPIVGSIGGGGGAVLGASTVIPTQATCDQYLTSFIKFGATNDADQVKRLQHVLKVFEGASIDENGVYDDASLSALKAFQLKYAADILTPWGISEPTGYTYLTTRKKVNEVYCANTKSFPLTEAELELIHGKQANPPAAAESTTPSAPEEEAAGEPIVETTTSEESPVSSPWQSISDFFKRLFNRGR